MTRAELLGRHSFSWGDGKQIHIFRREERYIARGRIDGRTFGETLGSNAEAAQVRLFAILAELNNGFFRPPSHPSRKQKKRLATVKVSFQELIEAYIQDVKRRKGKRTAARYRNWLNHLLAFTQRPDVARRYPYVINLDRDFVLDFIAFLNQRTVPRNGREGGKLIPMSKKGIREILDRLKAALVFAKKSEVNLLPVDFAIPVSKDVLPTIAPKDPLKGAGLTVEARIQLVGCMDAWQLTHVAPSLVLPCRPEEMAGVLIEEIDWENAAIRFGERFDGCDFTKGRQSWTLPVPPEVLTLLCNAAGFRCSGPVFQPRRFYESRATPKIELVVPGHLEEEVRKALQESRPSTPQDAKAIVRKTLRQCGGVSTDELREGFRHVCQATGLGDKISFYKCREAVTSDYETINMLILQRRYVTGHSGSDILNNYTSFGWDQLRGELAKHWTYIRQLLDAISARAQELGVECTREVA